MSPADSGEDTRRRATFTELPFEAIDLVDKLARERLLVTNISPTGAAQTVEVAHEALISNWVTLRAWVNEDREFLLWRKRLDGLLREWEGVGKDEGALLRGPLLIEAQKWLDKRSQDLSEEERSFINASRALRERLDGEEKKRQEKELEEAEKRAKEQQQAASKLRRLVWMLALVALAAAAAAIFAVRQRTEAKKEAGRAVKAERTANEQKTLAEQQKTEAERQARLATEAQQTAEKQPVLARAAEDKAKQAASQANVFLALNSNAIGNYGQELAYLAKALKLNGKNSEAGALIAALLTQESWPVLTGAMKHDGAVRSAQFSADGQRVVTASYDKTARVWDIPTITRKDSADDVNLLADLAEASAGLALQALGQSEIFAALTPDQVKATRDKIAAKFAGRS